MIQLCGYAQQNGCKQCSVVYFKECKKFLKAHYSFLARKILPLNFSKQKLHDAVVWSRDEDKAKSAALQYAMKFNCEIKHLSLNQVISLTVTNEDVEGKVFYIDYKQKLTGDSEKIVGVLKSFIDKVSMQGSCVSLFVQSNIQISLNDIHKL